MRNDDIRTVDDVARITRNEAELLMVLRTPEGGPHRPIESTTRMFYETARAATSTQASLAAPGAQTDAALLALNMSPRVQRLTKAIAEAKAKSRFRQVTRITPIPGGAPAGPEPMTETAPLQMEIRR